MRIAPKSKHYAKRPLSAKKRRKIKYQQNVVREWLFRSRTVFVEDYTNVKCDALMEELKGTQNEKCMALKDKKHKHHEKEAETSSEKD
jgi:hypothetical protein